MYGRAGQALLDVKLSRTCKQLTSDSRWCRAASWRRSMTRNPRDSALWRSRRSALL